MLLTADDVTEAYRLFLGRLPENTAVIEEKLQACPDCWSLVKAMLDCQEFAGRMRSQHTPRRAIADLRCSVEMGAQPEDVAHLRRHVQETWTRLGKTEPHYSVLTGPEFLPEQMSKEVQETFYATGAAWAEEFMVVLQRNGLLPLDGLVVDFGCGLGRVGEHLSTLFERYLGVDISLNHLAMARERLLGLGRTNAEFELLPEFLASSREVDIIYSVLVLQHNPPPMMLEMLNQVLSRLRRSGVAFIQIPTAIYDYSFDTASYLAGLGDVKAMEMHAIPSRYIFEAIKANGCDVVEVYRDDCVGSLGESYRFLLRKAA